MSKNIYQLQITLRQIKPKIWRRVLVPSNILLSDLHKIIQTAMSWTNSHLHQFVKDELFYTERIIGDRTWDELPNVDYKKIKIADLLNVEKSKIVYEYDFGDGWEHDIILEKILPIDKKLKYPVCLAGKMNRPPEDCGGIYGFSDMLKILKQPNHEEYESFIVWLDGGYDPEYFNIKEVNELLQMENYGCIELF